MAGVGLARETGEGGAGIGERIHADAEPGHAVAARDTHETEEQDHGDFDARIAADQVARRIDRGREHAEVDPDDRPDEDPQDQQKLALGDQVGLARLIDQLGDLEHRLVHRQPFELAVRREAEGQAEGADQQAHEQQRAARNPAQERRQAQIGQPQRRLAALGMLGQEGGGQQGHGGERREDGRQFRRLHQVGSPVCGRAVSGPRTRSIPRRGA